MANSGFSLRKSHAMTSEITEKSTIPKMLNISNNLSSVAKMVDKNKGSGASETMVSLLRPVRRCSRAQMISRMGRIHRSML